MYPILLFFFLSFQLIPQGKNAGIDDYKRIIEATESLLNANYPHFELEVRVVRTGGTISQHQPLQIVLPEKRTVPRGLTRVSILGNDIPRGQQESGWALVYIAHFDSVTVANRSLKQEENVHSDDIDFIWAEITRFRGEPLTPNRLKELQAGGDVFANRFIASNRMLRVKDLRNAYAATTGQSVNMRYNKNGFFLELFCKSRNNGHIGDTVKLFSPDTQRMYRARLEGPGTAMWQETLD